ncbi:hypothetical protein [Leeuwenhoekiella marinoflava]|uniref:Uncharacterized protein n=2 Tax=Leeuwenhoekiella marinoflava TaxID=988 RepID=A0A4Q0PRE7_9FLAO|nr:hypothetical protein [Leeuwenhoekiella marinoflava]RXG33143.1 hypothetical protein DSL99_238 [Leeuwenhoekiella marinoflava]SHE40014.1 hypothetical protein SAMN02745246_00296 [Leeuwenhoekiella marinoflava DSM 3653]
MFCILFLVFVACDLSNTSETKKILSTEKAINTEIKSDKALNRGFIKLDKENYISQNTQSILKKSSLSNNRLIKLGDLEPPYKIIKHRGNDTLIIIKNMDTVFFKMIDYSKDNKNDPTFKDFLKGFFGN